MATIIVEKATGEVVYSLPDDRTVVSRGPSKGLMVLKPDGVPDFGIADLDAADVEIVTGVTPPAEYFGRRYTYAAGVWAQKPDWVNPITAMNAERLLGMTAAEIIEAAALRGITLVEA